MVLLLLKRIISFFVLFFFASSLNALSIFEVVERVVNNSPELRVIFEKKNQAIQDYSDARSSYLPRIYVLFNREYSKTDPITSSTQTSWTTVNKFQLMVEQKLFDMEQASKLLKYSQMIQSSEFENQKLLENIIKLSVESYYDVIQAEYLVAIYKEYLRQVREVEKLTLNMRQQGDANLGDVNLVQSRLASANSNFLLYQANLDKAKLKLSYLLNLIDKNQLADYKNLFPDLTNKDFYDLGDRIVSVIPVSPEELIDQVLNNNIDILIIRSSLCVANYDLESQRARYLPQVSAQVELKSEEDRSQNVYSRVGKFNIEARYTIYDGGSRSAANKKYESVLKQSQYNYDILIRDVSDQSYSTLNQLKSYEQQRVSILKEIEAAEEVDRVYNIQFQFANRTLTERLDNLERLTTSRAKLVQMDYSILSTRLQILSLMGMFVEFFGFQNYLEANRLKLC